jgi:hypothetical protein
MNELKCWFVGVDWASENHRVRIADYCGKRLGERDFAHGGAGLAEMAAWLTSVAGRHPWHRPARSDHGSDRAAWD